MKENWYWGGKREGRKDMPDSQKEEDLSESKPESEEGSDQEIIISDFTENSIFGVWEERWRADEAYIVEGNRFCCLYNEVYQDVCRKNEKYKKLNFRFKLLYLLVLLLVPAALLIAWFCIRIKSANLTLAQAVLDAGWKDGVYGGVTVGMTVFLASVISKWIDIKKYQETWARHSEHKHKLEAEMLRYMMERPPYNGLDRKQKFVDRTLEIWDANQVKFVGNMENKEKPIADLLNEIKNLYPK